MFLAAIVKEHAASAGAAEPNSGAISHDQMTVEVTGVVAVPEDFLGVPAAAPDRRAKRQAPANRSRWV
jgi:hypothetical protein